MASARPSPVFPVLLFSALCAGALWFSLHLGDRDFSWPFISMIAYFTLLSLLLHLWQERMVHRDPRLFIRRFMGGLVLKLLLSLVVVVVLVKTSSVEKVPVITAFALLYLAYLGFSTARLVMLLKRPAG